MGKSVVAEYNAEQLLSMREQISTQIRSTLAKRADNFDIILDDVSITHLVFGKEFSGAIEQKQVAQQEAERQTYIDAAKEVAESLSRARGVTYLPSGGQNGGSNL